MNGAANLIGRTAITGIRLYQLAISAWFGTACRFTPGCSSYMQEAIHHHGVLRGIWLGARRIARCHPWGGSGYDPVPCASQSTAHIHGARRG